MELPVTDSGPVKETGSLFHCNYCDTEVVRKIAQLLLHGLASACVNNTTGDRFRNPSFVAVALRKEMVEYLTRRSEPFIAESIVGGDNINPNQVKEISEHPADIVKDFIDDFVNSKRNLSSRVSGWLLSESRGHKIDDFVQGMETNNLWPQGWRESVSELLLKSIDIKSAFHCTETFDTSEHLSEHRSQCSFRPVNCSINGCKATFSAFHTEKHDSACPFKVLPCKQNCEQWLMRREMDQHCITVCPMKLVYCPFYQVGCKSAFPQCTMQKHCSESIHLHLLYVLQLVNIHEASMIELKQRGNKQEASMEELKQRGNIQEASMEELKQRGNKQEASMEELKQRVRSLEMSHSLNEFSGALDARSLTLAIKEQEAKMKMEELERGLNKIQRN